MAEWRGALEDLVSRGRGALSGPVERCRSCGSRPLEPVLDLGATPLANRLPASADAPEERHPLAVALCLDCALLQTTWWVAGEVIFGGDYPYFSSYSTAYLAHARDHVRELIASRSLGTRHRVVEIASNDGYLLRNFVEAGIPVLGIDPARGPGEAARRAGVPTRVASFDLALAETLRDEGMAADVLLASNVLAHVDDPNELAAGVAALLAPEGVAVFEFPYLVDLVEGCAFDTIYHEHNLYLSLRAFECLFERHGLRVVELRRLAVHGGSLRVTVARRGEPSEAVRALRAEEERLGIAEPRYYRSFAERVGTLRRSLRECLDSLRAQGLRVAGYGAAAKAATLANVAGLSREQVAFVVDRNPAKQGRYLPGVGIPIVPPAHLEQEPPDVLLVFAWNLASEIRGQLEGFRGRFLVPIPEPRFLEPSVRKTAGRRDAGPGDGPPGSRDGSA